MTRFRVLLVLLSVAGVSLAAERHWQTGTWRDMTTRRKMIDFGPGSSGFGGPGAARPGPPGPTMRAMADVRTFVIETDDLRLDLEDTVPIGRRSIDVVIGGTVTFAVEKNAVYIRDPNGAEHKLRLVKKTARARAAPAAPATPTTLGTTTPAYAALGGGHLVRAASGDGRYVTLEDGSRWEIAPKDWYQTVDWEASANVTVRTFPQPENGFGYELTNTTNDEGVAANYLPGR